MCACVAATTHAKKLTSGIMELTLVLASLAAAPAAAAAA
jgi:hypothetical protein